MKASKTITTSVGAVGLILAGAAIAVTPGLPGEKSPFGVATPVFDQWSVTDGVITVGDCDAANTDFECGAALHDSGFMTRMITDTSSGEMFFQTIVTEADATGSADTEGLYPWFSDENFVSGGNNSGILDKQVLTEGSPLYKLGTSELAGAVALRNYTEIGTGWASDYLVLVQSIEVDFVGTDYYNDFQTDFVFHQDGYSDDVDKGVGMKITQYVPLGQQNILGVIDSQDFVLVDMRGSYVPSAGFAETPVESAFDYQNQLGGGSVFWNAGDRIYATWIGQDFDQVVGQEFGFVAYDNLTSPDYDRIQTFTIADSWHKDNADDSGGDENRVPGWDSSFWGNLATSGSLGGWGDNNISIEPPFIKSHPLEP